MEMVALNLKLKEVIVGCVVAKGNTNLGIHALEFYRRE